jgi:D-alanine-D-alanine ligase
VTSELSPARRSGHRDLSQDRFLRLQKQVQSGLTDEYCPADLPDDITEKLKRGAEAVFKALLLDVYARMDFIVDAKGDVYCLEANTLPV